MPKAAPINADLIRAVFTYDPETGALNPKPTAPLVVRRTDVCQWEVGKHRYSLHRLVWAYHHPENPNPVYITFKDGWRTNTRIENLEAKNAHPRWEGHAKQIKVKLSPDGHMILVGAETPRANAGATPKPTPLSKINSVQELVRHPPKVPDTRPATDTSWVDAFEDDGFNCQ